METRLELIYKDLVNKITLADEIMQRKVAILACEFAISQISLDIPLINQVRKALDELSFAELAKLRDEILELANRLDEIQWDLKDQLDLGNETMQNYLAAFSNARAVNALHYALDPDPFVAATETTYEAFAATDNPKSLERIINALLE